MVNMYVVLDHTLTLQYVYLLKYGGMCVYQSNIGGVVLELCFQLLSASTSALGIQM